MAILGAGSTFIWAHGGRKGLEHMLAFFKVGFYYLTGDPHSLVPTTILLLPGEWRNWPECTGVLKKEHALQCSDMLE